MLSNFDSAVKVETDPGEDGVLTAGDTIEYNMNVTNTGNTCLMGVRVMDDGMASIECKARYPGKWGLYWTIISVVA